MLGNKGYSEREGKRKRIVGKKEYSEKEGKRMVRKKEYF